MYDDLLGVLIDLGILLAFLLLFVPWPIGALGRALHGRRRRVRDDN